MADMGNDRLKLDAVSASRSKAPNLIQIQLDFRAELRGCRFTDAISLDQTVDQVASDLERLARRLRAKPTREWEPLS